MLLKIAHQQYRLNTFTANILGGLRLSIRLRLGISHLNFTPIIVAGIVEIDLNAITWKMPLYVYILFLIANNTELAFCMPPFSVAPMHIGEVI